MLTRLILVLALLAAGIAPAAAERVALVIGNGAYRQVPPLENPTHDARDVHAALTRLGFASELVLDADRPGLEAAIRRFGDRAVGADAAMLFYAGHAVEVGGRNFMIPVTARIRSDRDLPFEALDFDTVMTQLEGRARVILLFLDACRDNPFRLALAQGTRGVAGRGLAPVRGPVGTLVAFSTAPGTLAQDGAGRNSPFTGALLQHIETPGLEVRPMLGRVRQTVREATAGAQIPWENSSLEGEFYFRPVPQQGASAAAAAEPPRPAPPLSAGADPATERLFWESIRDSRSVAEFEAYLSRYPNGVFSELARARIAALARPAPAPEARGVSRIEPTPPVAPPARAEALPRPPAPPVSAPRAPAPPAPRPAPDQQVALARPPAPSPPTAPPAPAPADPGCVVVIHAGMDKAAGAPGRIEMRNTGGSCSFTLYQDQIFRQHYVQIRITEKPANGEVTVANPAVSYRPRPGFAGEDRFVIDTVPDGRLIVTVRVLPPG